MQVIAERPGEPVEEEPGFDSHAPHLVDRWRNGASSHVVDAVAEEIPVAMVYNGVSHAVMLATPTRLEEFGLGFSLSEGILNERRELYDIEIVRQAEGLELQMSISQERFAALKQKRRNLAGRTGCGLCGAESLQQVIRQPKPVISSLRISPQTIHRAFEQLAKLQTLQAITGAVHAAAWASPDSSILHMEEDIGRHNALDKLIGSMARNNTRTELGFAVITSRASYEMVQKTAAVGIPLLAAISAPTGLAIELAKQAGITLIGFARHDNHVVYANPQRLEHL